MVTRQPAYNASFHCLGGACPDTCCRDWDIVVDDAAIADYKSAPQPLADQLRAGLTTDEDGDLCFTLREDGFCTLLTPEGLCAIQKHWGEAHLCAHCAAYPRFTEEFGSLTETALAVSCPEAARLLMELPRFTLSQQDDGVPDRPFDGVDKALLAGLEHSRRQALALLEEPLPLWTRLTALLSFAGQLQSLILTARYPAMEHCSLCLTEPEGEPHGRRLLSARFLTLCARFDSLRPSWPQLLKHQAAVLAQMTPAEYQRLCPAFEAHNPGWDRRLTNFAAYFLFRHWHKTVNDDNLYGRAALCAAACLALYHLSLLHWVQTGSLSQGDEISLWSRFSREIEHQWETLDSLAQLLSDDRDWPLRTVLSAPLPEVNP